MKNQSNGYIYTFGLVMTVVVALVLAGLRFVTADKVAQNEDVFNKREILASVSAPLADAGRDVGALTDEEVLAIFDEQIDQIALDANGEVIEGVAATDVLLADEFKKRELNRRYPLNVFNLDGEKYYIFSVRGNGLWDAIWGNIALEDDFNTVAGASFDHAGETPGLGAEIKDNSSWKAQFQGKKIYNGDRLVSINVRKGGAIDPDHDVDGLSGATVTADGVTDMLWNGLKAYEPYLDEKRSASSK